MPSAGFPVSSDGIDSMHGGHGTAALQPSVHSKGEYVRGLVESVNGEAAVVILESGEKGRLAWSNYTKSLGRTSRQAQLLKEKPPLAVGEKIWACVQSTSGGTGRQPEEGAKGAAWGGVVLSTAALEVRPGDMVDHRAHVFAAIEQWKARGGSTPLGEWRGRIELEQFLAGDAGQVKGGGAKGQSSTAAAAVAAAGDEQEVPGNEGREGAARADNAWGLITQPILSRGDLVRGKVTSTQSFGVFVSLGGVMDALLPTGLISKAFADGKHLASGTVFPRGSEIFALVKSLEGEVQVKGRGDEDGRRAGQGWGRGRGAGAREKAGPGQKAQKAAPAGVLPPQKAVSPSTSSPRITLSTRALEAEEGLILRDLQQYNVQAKAAHEQYKMDQAENNVDQAAELEATFK